MKKALLVFIIFLCSLYTIAQSNILEFDHTTILVKNVEQSVEFYKNILHLKELKTPWENYPSIRFFEIGINQQLHIAQIENDGIKLNKVIHIAFTVTDFDGYLSFLNDNGIKYSNFKGDHKKIQIRPDGVKQIYFQDPDGYWIEINDAKH